SARPDRATLGARSAGLPPQPAIERSYRGRQPHRREAPKNRTWFPQLSELSPPATSQPWCEMANSTHHQDTRPPTPQDRVEPRKAESSRQSPTNSASCRLSSAVRSSPTLRLGTG